jgi:hypothetical protein
MGGVRGVRGVRGEVGVLDPLLLGVAAVLGELLRDHLRECDVKEHACAKHGKRVSNDVNSIGPGSRREHDRW